jgi:hypothetical protein
VDEAERAGRGIEIQLAPENLPAESRHHEQAQGPAGDGRPRHEKSR